jgi:predicted transposase YbfD/YdcC
VAEKTNEMVAIPALLDLLVLKGGIVTLDANGCQQESVKPMRVKAVAPARAISPNRISASKPLSQRRLRSGFPPSVRIMARPTTPSTDETKNAQVGC